MPPVVVHLKQLSVICDDASTAQGFPVCSQPCGLTGRQGCRTGAGDPEQTWGVVGGFVHAVCLTLSSGEAPVLLGRGCGHQNGTHHPGSTHTGLHWGCSYSEVFAHKLAEPC